MATMVVVVVRTGAEARPQSQCNVLGERKLSGPSFALGGAPTNVCLPSVLMVLKLNFPGCPHTHLEGGSCQSDPTPGCYPAT